MHIILRLLKNLITVVLVSAVITLIAGLIYLNQIGFPGQHGDWVRQELSKRGLEVDFESLRFSPRKGLIATNAQFFANSDDSEPTLTADFLSIDVDKILALRGEFKLRKVSIIGGQATFQVEEDEELLASEINANITISEDQLLQIRDAHSLIQGLQVSLEADLILPKKKATTDSQKKPSSNKILRTILNELSFWKFPTKTAPQVTLQIRGDLNDFKHLQIEFEVEAHQLQRNDYAIEFLNMRGELRDEFASIERILLVDDSGEVEGLAEWDVAREQGRFELSSSIDLKNFLASSFGMETATDLSHVDPPYLQIHGELAQTADQKLSVCSRGYAALGPFTFREHRYDELQTQFSWNDGDLYLQELEVKAKGQTLIGDLLIKGDLVRYRFDSNLPLSAFSPFISKDSPTDQIISRFKFEKNSTLDVSLEGNLNRNSSKGISAKGTMRSSNLTYRKMSLHELSSDFVINPTKVEFTKIKALLDDRSELARQRFKGPASEAIEIDRLQIDRESRITYINKLEGTFWPTPVIRAFAPKSAAHLEDKYRFHNPPALSLTGAFTGNKDRLEDTHFHVTLRTSGQTDYPFLSQPLPVQNLRADITMKGRNLQIDRLAFATLNGQAGGNIAVKIIPDQLNTYQGDIRWNDISFPALSKVYRFDKVEKGSLLGRIQFSGAGGDIRRFNAEGGLELKQGNLVSLPILGPLSPLMAGILGDKRMGYERAKDGRANFVIEKGIWKTKNLVATSENLVLTGDGWIDLKTLKIDMTIRTNVRGLLGVIAIPLSPFKGLFQFRGTGQFTNPKWQNANFTAPTNDKDPIFRNPFSRKTR